MADEGFKRKLAAILSADVEGYSRLMDDDEEATVRTLKTYRAAINDLVQQYRGRIVDSPGDNILAEFSSVVDAVNCAVEVQRELAERNTELPYNRKMEFRIGVNLGDVIEDDGNIYGDGVNIAARVESMAEAGGICISGRAYDQVSNKLGLEYENLGEHQVKNISTPIRVYRVLSHPGAAAHRVVQAKDALGRRWRKIALSIAAVVAVAAVLGIWQYYARRPTIEPASVDKMAFPLPDKPSIAVLPFDNLSKNQSDSYIADGLSENIISSLSKVPDMLVIARNSTFVYKGKAVKVNQVAEELGVRYVLEGSVQKSDDKIRVIAQLIDAVSGHHLWSEKYDREIKDFFQLMDEITLKIIAALRVKLIWGGNVHTVSTTSFEAWSYDIKGGGHFRRFTKQDNIKARELYKQAIKIDPEHVGAWTMLGWTYFSDARNGFTDTPLESIKQAVLTSQKASAIDDSAPLLQTLWASLYLIQRQHEKAIAAGQKAIELEPNYADGYALLAQIMYYSGRSDEAITLMQQAMRLSPYPPAYYLIFLGMAYQGAGHYQEALPVLQKLLDRAQKGEFSRLFANNMLALNYALMGDYKKAREYWAEVLKIYPDASLEFIRSLHFFKDPDQLEGLLDAYRAAGISEHPPLKLPDKPSIAVLPFDNMSKDPEQEYFADGMTDDLITDLSQISGLFVIARNSSFQYKGKAVDVKKVSRELGIRYVLEGSVRKAGDEVRINAKLIDATTGGHMWAKRYDGQMDDIFSLQDKITQKIVEALAVKLTIDEKEAIPKKDTDNLEAYLTFLKGWQHYRRFNPDEFLEAIPLFEKAIELDPNYWRAYATLAKIYWEVYERVDWCRSLGLERYEAGSRMNKYLDVAMKNPTPLAHGVSVEMLVEGANFDGAIAEAKKAVNLNSNDPEAHYAMGFALIFAGKHKEAVDSFKKVMRLDPLHQDTFGYYMGIAYFHLSQFKKAASLFERALKSNPKNGMPWWWLTASYAHLGNDREAETALANLREIYPSISNLYIVSAIFKYKNRADYDLLADGLRKAGME